MSHRLPHLAGHHPDIPLISNDVLLGADMTELPLDSSRPHCQAGRGCDHAPCFQARLDATAGQYRVHKRTDLCAEHLGAAIQAITAWAHDEGLRGEVTVFA